MAIGKKRKAMGLVKEEDPETLDESGSSGEDKVMELEYIIVYGLDSEESLFDCE